MKSTKELQRELQSLEHRLKSIRCSAMAPFMCEALEDEIIRLRQQIADRKRSE